MSDTGAKRRSIRVSTSGSVGSGSSHKIKKPPSGTKLSSNDATLKGSGSGQVVGQFNSMNTDGEASEDERVSDSKMNTPQAKHFNNGAIIGSPLGSINYDMEKKEEVEVAVKKSFALDINLLAVKEKLAMTKTQVIRRLFSGINGFGGATILSKFERIIRSMFTLSENMKKAVSLARKNNIIVNSNLKRQRIRSDQTIVIKEISIDTPKKMIVTTVSKFGQIKLIKIQLIGLWQKTVVEFAELEQAVFLAVKWSFLIGKDSVCVAMAVGDHETWVSKDQFRVLLFTLPVEMTAHNFGDLLDGAGNKTCIINCSLETGNKFCYAVVGFVSDKLLKFVFYTEPILGSIRLSWTRLDLVWCEQCGKFGHSALKCDAEITSISVSSNSFKRVVFDENCFQLAHLYVKKCVLISRLVAFGGKSWAQVVSLASLSNNPRFGFDPGFDSFSSDALDVISFFPHMVPASTSLEAHLASLECFVELLVDKVSDIVSKLENLVLVPPALTTSFQNLVVPVVANVEINSDMALNDPKPILLPSSLVSSSTSELGSSSLKILISKVGCLESKLMALEALVCSVLEELD
ncbi:hypothetical protein G9A89_019945 [Geosiphon pyriformis]|nr:hypothetical protein G9A89_019945 [Geosiphon pyriformis]